MGVSLQKDGIAHLRRRPASTPPTRGASTSCGSRSASARRPSPTSWARPSARSPAPSTPARASIDEQSARLADRIGDVDARLEKKRQNLLAQYAKFEAALGRMKAVGDSMSAQFTGLLNSNKNS
jgi:hypothetical protein